MDYYIENPSHEYQIDYIVFDCIVNERRKIYSKEERQSYLSSLLLSPPLEVKLSPDVLGYLWEIDAELVIQSIERQTSEMRAQIERLNLGAGKYSAKHALQINEMKQQLEVQAVECSKLLVEEPHGPRFLENMISEVDFIEDQVVIEDCQVGFPFMHNDGQEIVDLVNRDGLDAFVDASKYNPKSEPLVGHGKSTHDGLKREGCHLPIEEVVIILQSFLLQSPCFKPWDPGGSSYNVTITSLFYTKVWEPEGMSHVGSTSWSFYHKLWDPGGFLLFFFFLFVFGLSKLATWRYFLFIPTLSFLFTLGTM